MNRLATLVFGLIAVCVGLPLAFIAVVNTENRIGRVIRRWFLAWALAAVCAAAYTSPLDAVVLPRLPAAPVKVTEEPVRPVVVIITDDGIVIDVCAICPICIECWLFLP